MQQGFSNGSDDGKFSNSGSGRSSDDGCFSRQKIVWQTAEDGRDEGPATAVELVTSCSSTLEVVAIAAAQKMYFYK